MPIHDVGYRTWKGKLTSTWTRWWTISEAGLQAASKSRWVRRILLTSWFPVIYFAILLFAFEQFQGQEASELLRMDEVRSNVPVEVGEFADEVVAENPELQIAAQMGENEMRRLAIANHPMLRFLPNGNALAGAIDTGDEGTMRNTVWNWLLATFLRYPQGMMTLMIVGLVVPPLISRDVRSRAFLLYYSRPITRFEYLLGKLVIPCGLLTIVTMLPGLVLYMFGVMLSPDLTVIFDTWDTPLRVVLATLVGIIPVSIIALLFSSMSQESRFAGFAWFTVWGLGAVVWWVIYISNFDGENPFESNWSLVSLYSTIGKVQSWVFGLESLERTLPSMIVLGSITVLSSLMLYRRVSAPVRI